MSATGSSCEFTHTLYNVFLNGKVDFSTFSENFSAARPLISTSLYMIPRWGCSKQVVNSSSIAKISIEWGVLRYCSNYTLPMLSEAIILKPLTSLPTVAPSIMNIYLAFFESFAKFPESSLIPRG